MADVKDYPPYLDYPKERKNQTNADKIKQAGNESEMASAFIDFLCSVPCIGGKCKTPDKTCH